jgi:phage/plasmid-like protein (TIGR03299 family)
MAHALSFNNGMGQMFSVRETPWHREGHILTAAPSYAEALTLGGLDFEVDLRPAYIRKIVRERREVLACVACGEVSNIDVCDAAEADECAFCGGDMVEREIEEDVERFVASELARVVVRTDNDVELGSVGTSYTVLQNADAFRVLLPLLDAGVAHLETGGSLRDGADVWLMVRFDTEKFGPIVQEVFGDEVLPFGLIANNHDGRRGVLLQLTPIRVVCGNTLGMAELQAARGSNRAMIIKHTQGVEANVVAAAETMFQGFVDRMETVAAQYRKLKAVALEESEFRTMVLDVIAPRPQDDPDFNPDAKLAAMVVERADRKRNELTRLWTQGIGHTGDGSAWEAYNGAVEALDHNAELWPTRGGVWRTASLLDGALGEKKALVLNGLVRHADRRLAGAA